MISLGLFCTVNDCYNTWISYLFNSFKTASTTSWCSLVLNLLNTWLIFPSRPIKKLRRWIPSYSLPINFFKPHTPNWSATWWSTSDNIARTHGHGILPFYPIIMSSCFYTTGKHNNGIFGSHGIFWKYPMAWYLMDLTLSVV